MAATTRLAPADLLAEACVIACEYSGNLTLRQLYYQLVARGHSPNTQDDYNRIKDTLVKARIAGTFSFDWLIDRSRTVHPGEFTRYQDDVEFALDEAAGDVKALPAWNIYAARWWGQKTHVSVWVEKEALAGVFEGPCKNLGVSWFAAKGYPSLSSLYDWVKGVHDVVHTAEEAPAWGGLDRVVVIYFGDHDPDGWQIPRSAMNRVREIQHATGLHLPTVELDRVALNMDQIRAYNPPPFPAKMTSSRYKGYVEEHQTKSAWELDALQPDQLQKLIRDSVNAHFDADRFDAVREVIVQRRELMRAKMRTGDWLAKALGGE